MFLKFIHIFGAYELVVDDLLRFLFILMKKYHLIGSLVSTVRVSLNQDYEH